MTSPALTPLRRGQLSVSAAAVAWGIGGAAAAELFRISGLGPMAVSFWRFAIAAIILTAPKLLDHGPLRPAGSARGLTSVLVGTALAVYQTAYFGAVQEAGLALGTLVALGTSTLLVSVGAHLFLGERLSRRGTAATGLALIGLVILVAHPVSGPHPFAGVLLALVSGIGYSAVTLWARRSEATSASPATWGAGALCLLPFALAEGVRPHAENAVESVTWLLFLGVVPTLLAYRWYFKGLVTVPSTTAAVLVLLEPATAALLAVALGERISVSLAVGSVLLLSAVAVLARDRS
ncbi:EamA family transporter [Streptomyces sp. NPDC016469]|uniref:DMT family transporter n=1 Tax=Streptomyces sp. NPDC016469 TaxID=3157191 RepID=UPI0033E5D621